MDKKLTIEEILFWIHIRFGGENQWKDKKISKHIFKYGYEEDIPEYTPLISENKAFNRNGTIYVVNNGINPNLPDNTPIWAIAEIKEKPNKWVTIKDMDDENWKLFENWFIEYATNTLGSSKETVMGSLVGMQYFSNDGIIVSKQSLIGYQFLTLDQWKELVYEDSNIK